MGGNMMRGEGSVTIGSQTFSLVYDCNAVCVLEQALNMPLAKFANSQEWLASHTGLRALLYAGLSRHYKGMTLERCGDLLSGHNQMDIAGACMKAFIAAFPQATEGNADATEKSADGSGQNSSPSPVKAV